MTYYDLEVSKKCLICIVISRKVQNFKDYLCFHNSKTFQTCAVVFMKLRWNVIAITFIFTPSFIDNKADVG